MYIQPNTTIKILHNIPIDVTYEHTLDFSNATAQQTYFASKAKYTLDEYTYQRSRNNAIKVEKKIGDLYDCNYIMFKNTSFENRWFYGFITNLNYINNDVTEIEYQLDIMQTWLFDYSLQNVFVEREHASTDNIGDNTVPETLETGEYVIHKTLTTDGMSSFSSYTYMVLTTFDPSQVTPSRIHAPIETIGNLMQGLGVKFFDTPSEVDGFVSSWSAYSDGIIGIYQVPTVYKTAYASGVATRNQLKGEAFEVEAPTNYFGWDNSQFVGTQDYKYTPKNNKLFTYPYSLIAVENGQGNSAEFRYEYFRKTTGENAGRMKFYIQYGLSASPSFSLSPYGYKTSDISLVNRNERIMVTGLPQLPWASDTFKAWLTQTAGSLAVTGLSAVVGAASGNPFLAGITSTLGATTTSSGISTKSAPLNNYPSVMGVTSKTQQESTKTTKYDYNARPQSIYNIAGILGQIHEHAITPPQFHGNLDSTLNLATDSFGYRFYSMKIRPEYAKIIDEYFSMYGYATHRIKTPNTKSRRYWNYIKTQNCKIIGSIPTDDEEAICSLYNSGITFWHDPSKVGDYTLNNSIV